MSMRSWISLKMMIRNWLALESQIFSLNLLMIVTVMGMMTVGMREIQEAWEDPFCR